MNRILLDTSAYSRLLRGSVEVLDALVGAERVNMSVFVLAEFAIDAQRPVGSIERIVHVPG